MAPSKKNAKKMNVKTKMKTAKAPAKPQMKAKAKAMPAKKAASAKMTAKPAKAATTTTTPSFSAAVVEKMVTPLGDRLLIFVEAPPEKTAGGLYIPSTADATRPTRGKVVAKGMGRRNKKGQVRPLDVTVGDFVLFPDYAGTKLQLQGTELLMIHEEEVLGIAE